MSCENIDALTRGGGTEVSSEPQESPSVEAPPPGANAPEGGPVGNTVGARGSGAGGAADIER